MDTNGTDKLLNTPIPLTFKVGEGTIEVAFHEMTLLERSAYRRTLESKARNTWLQRLKEIATISYERPEEKRKFLADAAQREPDLEADITRLVMTEEGILLALQTAGVPVLSKENFDLLNASVDNAPSISKALNTVFGIPEVPDTTQEAPVQGSPGEPPANPPTAQSAGS